MTDLLLPLGAICLFGVIWLYVDFRYIGTIKEKGRDTLSAGHVMVGLSFIGFSLWLSGPRELTGSLGLFLWLSVGMFPLGLIVMAYGSHLRARVNTTADEPESSTEEDSP